MVNYRIDRIYPHGIGRIALSSGTDDKVTFTGILVMLSELGKAGRVDVFEGLKRGRISPVPLYEQWKGGKALGVGDPRLGHPLKAALSDWLDGQPELASETKRGYSDSINQLMKLCTEKTPVRDLPSIVEQYRIYCCKTGKVRTFAKARTVALAFARDSYKKSSSLYIDIKSHEPIKSKKKPKDVHHPLTVADMDALAAKLPPNVAAMCWTMATTGMGPREYLVDGFTDNGDSITIHGAKNSNRDRVVPYLMRPAQRCLAYQRLREVVKAARPHGTLYDFRRTYAVWMESAGILLSHRNAYMGHASSARMSDLYTRQKMNRFLADDAKLMTEFIDRERQREKSKT